MPDPTRRRALLAVTSGIAALAGCASEDDRPTTDNSIDDRPIEDYDVRSVRNEDGAVLFARGELPEAADDERGRTGRSGRLVLVSDEDVDELTFNDVSEAERLRSFVTATDFDSSSLYLSSMPVEACYEIRLQSVAIDWDEIDAEDLRPYAGFCQTYRPADVECGTDEIHTAGFAIRLPVAAERSSGSGGGMSRSCQQPRRGEYFEAPVTPADGGEDE